MSEPIVDSHHHLLDPGRIDYRVLKYLPELDRFIGPDELAPLLRDAGVDRTVIVQAEESEAETDYITELARTNDWIAGVVGWVPLADPEATGNALERHRGGPLVGVRHGLFWEADESWIFRDPVVESIGLLAEQGLTYDLVPMADRHWDAVEMLAERVRICASSSTTSAIRRSPAASGSRGRRTLRAPPNIPAPS